MKTQTKQFVAPDGGWGWVACFGVSLVNLATRSMEPSFGLLFGDLLRDLDVGTTGASVIISTLDVCMNFSGLFVGPLLKEFSYRKVAIAGSLLCTIGLACTSPAASMPHILSTYGVINGIGVGLATSAAFVALNHYFKHKRGQAVGLSMAGTALGMLIMPQLVRFLLELYGFRGAVLLLAGVALNATVGAVLLQPAKWHMKEVIIIESDDDNDCNELSMMPGSPPKPEIIVSSVSDDLEKPHYINGSNEEDALPEMKGLLVNKHLLKPLKMRKNFSEMAMDTLNTRLDVPKRPAFPRITSLVAVQNAASNATTNGYNLNSTSATRTPLATTPSISSIIYRKHSVTSNLSYMDFTGSILQVHLNVGDEEFERNDRALKRISTPISLNNAKDDTSFLKMNASYDKEIESNDNNLDADYKDRKQDVQTLKKSSTFWKRFADLMDVDLLKDKMFLNILFGLSIFYVAEMNFKMVTPFFFNNLGYNKTDVAFCLSITAITDIAARIILPPIFDRTNIKKRTIFLVSIIFVAITRSIMAEQTEWSQLMVWLSICGLFRGSALSNFTLTVSEYCSLEKLPSAFGWHLVGKAIFVICFGPLIGLIRDVTGSFPICIHAQSLCISLCAFAWTIEYIITYFRERKMRQMEMKTTNANILVDSDHNIK